MTKKASDDIIISLYLKASNIMGINPRETHTSPITDTPCTFLEYARHNAALMLQIIDTYIPFDKTFLGITDPIYPIKEVQSCSMKQQ